MGITTPKTVFGTIAAAMVLGGLGRAQADSRALGATGSGLAVVEACARHVSVETDATLSGQIAIELEAVHPEEIAQIAAATVDGRARVGLQPALRECWRPEPGNTFTRSLTLRIRVPPGFPVSVEDDGSGDYAIGAIGPFTVAASGAKVFAVDHVDGDTRLALSGRSSVEIGQLDAARLDANLSGAGSLQVRAGKIGSVHVADSGATRVEIEPVVETASLATSGVGSIRLGGVRGALSRASSGLGRITVGGRPPVAAVSEDRDD